MAKKLIKEEEKKAKGKKAKKDLIQMDFFMDQLDVAREISDELELSDVDLFSTNKVDDAISSGLLVSDLITGGGIAQGFSILAGETGAGKSSSCFMTMKDALDKGIPIYVFDYEGGTNPQLLQNILEVVSLKDVFGIKDKDGKWLVKPKIVYFQPSIGETGFRFINRLLKRMPNKVKKDGQWYLVFDKDQKSKLEGKYKIKKFKGSSKLYVETPNGDPQALFIMDSLASLVAEDLDENDEKSPMAVRARMFSEFIPLVVSKLGSKNAVMIAINQLRERPMGFGDPRYTPGGKAPDYYSSMTMYMTPVAPSTAGEKGDGTRGGVEDCFDGKGEDVYKYTKLFTKKNRNSAPSKDAKVRIWLSSKGVPRGGFDPVYDVREYLQMTGQIDMGRVYQLFIPGIWTQRKWTYKEFKDLLLNPNKASLITKYKLKIKDTELVKKMTKYEKEIASLTKELAPLLKKPEKYKKKIDRLKKDIEKTKNRLNALLDDILDLRQACWDQFDENGTAFDLYAKTSSGEGESDQGDDDDDEEDDDDEDDDEF